MENGMRLASFARFPLTMTPTPLMRAWNLERELGPGCPRVYLKRDDLTGLAFGGNKARKLEYLVAAAIGQGATALVSEGAVQSNHARLTAAAAAAAGLKCVLILDARRGAEVQGNLLLDHLLGAEVRIAPDTASRSAMMATIGDELRTAGETPYIVPTGGSVPLGALGYVAFVLELAAQLVAIGETPRRLYFCSGSGGTQAGLVVGARAFSAPWVPYGISDGDPAAELRAKCRSIADGAAELLGLDTQFEDGDIVIDDRYYGRGYAIPTEEGLAAIRLLARTEAVFLEPVYTGKAMAGLLDQIRRGELSANEAVVFLHSGGGPSLFAFRDALADSFGDGELMTR